MDRHLNYKKKPQRNKYSQPILVFDHTDTFSWVCHTIDVFEIWNLPQENQTQNHTDICS